MEDLRKCARCKSAARVGYPNFLFASCINPDSDFELALAEPQIYWNPTEQVEFPSNPYTSYASPICNSLDLADSAELHNALNVQLG